MLAQPSLPSHLPAPVWTPVPRMGAGGSAEALGCPDTSIPGGRLPKAKAKSEQGGGLTSMEERLSSDFEAQRPAGGIPAARPSGTVDRRDWSCLTQQERDFGSSGVETGAAGKTVPCKPAAAGSPAAGVHGGLSRLRGCVCITPFFFSKTRILTQKQN